MKLISADGLIGFLQRGFSMEIQKFLLQARHYMAQNHIDGWLMYEYRHRNSIIEDIWGDISNITRPYWIWIPVQNEPIILASIVDQGRFDTFQIECSWFSSQIEMKEQLQHILSVANRISMEYSPDNNLPRISIVDAGTIELVRSLGLDILSSADLVQYSTQRWTNDQIATHITAAKCLDQIVHEAFDYVSMNIMSRLTEYDLAEFIRVRYDNYNLEYEDGPVVALNENSSYPHYEPSRINSKVIKYGDWLLIDLWGRLKNIDSMYADITWTAFVGENPSDKQQEIFSLVTGARDKALSYITGSFEQKKVVRGWEVDRVAREFITRSGFGDNFGHRLGHSLGRHVHGNAVNLDSWETFDTREIVSNLAVTIEPGIYLPEFGIRSEIDVFISEQGPQVTTEMQEHIVLIK